MRLILPIAEIAGVAKKLAEIVGLLPSTQPESDEERIQRDLYPHYSGRNHPWQR